MISPHKMPMQLNGRGLTLDWANELQAMHFAARGGMEALADWLRGGNLRTCDERREFLKAAPYAVPEARQRVDLMYAVSGRNRRYVEQVDGHVLALRQMARDGTLTQPDYARNRAHLYMLFGKTL